MLIQLIAFSDTPKYSADVVEMEEKDSHCRSQPGYMTATTGTIIHPS